MLVELKISDLAIVNQLHLTFQPGLNVLTGETGAGKSIIIGAMGFLLGDRASKESIRDGSDEAVVEGTLSALRGDGLDRILDAMGIPREKENTSLRLYRSLSRGGRSRAAINGKSATLPMLQEVGRFFVELHGQNEHQSLLRPDVQLAFLDAFSKTEKDLSAYRQAYREGKDLDASLKRFMEEDENRRQTLDLLTFQARELREASLKIDEDRELMERRAVVSQTERLSGLAGEARSLLTEADPSALDLLGQVNARLKGLADADRGMTSTAELFRDQIGCLKDVADTLRKYLEELQSSPDELARIDSRLFVLESVKRKYGGSIESALTRRHEVEKRLDDLDHFDERLADLEARRDPAWERIERLGKTLSETRRKGAGELEKRVTEEFGDLKLPKCRIEIEGSPRAGRPEESWTEQGGEEIRFLISTNPGERPKPIERVLSGGELSRIMLALRTVLAEVDRTPVLIFDEIDAGIGGGVAEAVGIRLKRLAKDRQVICITHLPQIAAYADVHTVIAKEIKNRRSVVLANVVEGPDREEEIARMLGGIRITPTTRRHAREMLNGAG